ncbi:MAG: DUF86 domain-containing protein [Polyangia bacterium]|jgi:uncharacterized protein with HEPN domain
MSRESRLYLEDILAACQKVARYCAGLTRTAFEQNEMAYDAVVRNLELIGEAAKAVPEPLRQRLPSIEWRKICGLRDVLAHAYFGIDNEILWDVIENKVPVLARELDAFLSAASES